VKIYTVIGICLILIGVFAFTNQGFTFATKEKIVDVGPIHMTAANTRTVPFPPIVGGLSLAGGIVLLATGKMRR
jgi:multisubunit Na+/H+ antiporter MnhB subunit